MHNRDGAGRRGSSRQHDVRSLVRRVFTDRAKEPFLTLNLLSQHWPAVVGPEVAARSRPQRLERGTLWIATPDACWAYELQFFKAELLNSVQTFLESRTVSDLRFRAQPAEPAGMDAAGTAAAGTVPVSPAPAEPVAASPGPVPATPAERPLGRLRRVVAAAGSPGAPAGTATTPVAAEAGTPPALARAAAGIGDPALRAVFQRSLAKQRQAHARPGAAGRAEEPAAESPPPLPQDTE